MPERVRIELRPLGRVLAVARGTPLRDLLWQHGVEFPCGGLRNCGRCRVRLIEGEMPPRAGESGVLTAAELEAGWRLACRAQAEGDAVLEVEQLDAPILVDHTHFDFVPRSGYGVAVDLGTTTMAAQLLDLATGHVLAVRTARNPQGSMGADIMSRLQFARAPAGREQLTTSVRSRIGRMIRGLLTAAGLRAAPLEAVVVVGNTAMHHLFCGLDTEPLARVPFQSPHDGLQEFPAASLGWRIPGAAMVRFLPALGGFVGSDVLAGLLATRMHERPELAVLVDLGTNAEIVAGNSDGLLCTSAAAGPAFEGGRIAMGMQAGTGAICGVSIEGGELRCRVIGGGRPRGICGSGLVDAVAAALELGWLAPNGRLAAGRPVLVLHDPVHLTQADVRELQLAKGAIAAGIRLLLGQLGARPEQVARVYVAGAFGNYVDQASARRIGLLDFPDTAIEPVGNSALLGAKIALFGTGPEACEQRALRAKVRHVSLAELPGFQDAFIQALEFPR
ncbi:MAG: DUF4445 domain-containing protein [Gammaproteobacteria bacterium]|nr:DUF4445 domain-containing protein [Gammaproteobacteria bacterium]